MRIKVGRAPVPSARDRARRRLALALLAAALTGGAADAQAAGDPVEVRNAVTQFNDLKHHGEALAWRLPTNQGAPPVPTAGNHYQGVARYPGPGAPLLYVTQKDNDDPVAPPGSDPGGYLHVARMGSRPTSGERMRSNLQSLEGDTDDVDPKPEDTWLRSIRFDGSLKLADQTLPAYVHPGGMAIIDDVLLMALDQPQTDGAPDGQIVLFDLRPDPASPKPIRALPLDHRIDNLAATRQDGSILIWTNGDSGNVTRFYRTSTSDLRAPGLTLTDHPQMWNPDSWDDFDSKADSVCGQSKSSFPTGVTAYQGSAFLRQTNGDLFMVMTRNTHFDPNVQMCDLADLYRVDAKPAGGFRLVRVASKHMYCSYDGAGTICNFAAAANAYVSPSGELMLYSLPHFEQIGSDPLHVRLAEFRHRDVNTDDSPLRDPSADAGGPYEVDEGAGLQLSGSGSPAADRPWVELYQHHDWEGRSIVVDLDDSDDLELRDFTALDGFNDRASSVRWRAPVGLDIELYEHVGRGGEKHVLKGTGKTEWIENLADFGFGDRISSLRWVPDEAPASSLSFAWDLDSDGEFDDSTSATPTFGPTTQEGDHTVRLRVTDATGASAVDTTTVTVRNAPPDCSTVAPSPNTLWAADHQFRTITLSGATDPGGDPLTLTVTGVTQDESVNGLADGNTTPDAALVPGRTDQVDLRAERSSTGNGRVYHVAFTVADDQGADCAGTVDVGVVKDIGTASAIDSGAVFDSFTGP
jgi:hypothetical protein